MKVRIENEDIKIIEDLKVKKYFIRIKKKVIFYSVLYVVVVNIAVCLILLFNNAFLNINLGEFIHPLVITILAIGFLFILEKNILRKKILYKRYQYLLNDFEINIDEIYKTLILKSKQVEIKVLITSDNVKINDEYILLFNGEDVIGIIPILKVRGEKEGKQLISLLNKYI